MLAEKIWHVKIKDKLEQSDCHVDFQIKIIDKQLLAESDNQEQQLEPNNVMEQRSIATFMRKGKKDQKGHNPPLHKSVSQWHMRHKKSKAIEVGEIPLTQEQYGKLAREAEDIVRKRQMFSQRHSILNSYSRDNHGNLRTERIQELKSRLNESRRDQFNNSLILYVIISIVALFIGMKI